jgi:hypothetical protein
MVEHYFTQFVAMHTGERLKKGMQVYQMLGFPGCLGSGDVTHVLWDKCPVQLANLCKGKEGSPSLGYFVLVDHHKYIQYCSNGFEGATNDKTIANVDKMVQSFREGAVNDVIYYILDENGELTQCRGGYMLTDNGFHEEFCFVDPFSNRYGFDYIHWSEWLESIRKDVECTFGILKRRFRILKQRMEFHDRGFIDNIFKVCCILHNMILVSDGNMVDEMMSEEYWEQMDPDQEDIEDLAEVVVEDDGESKDEKAAQYVAAYGMITALPKNGRETNFIDYTYAGHRNIKGALLKSFKVYGDDYHVVLQERNLI